MSQLSDIQASVAALSAPERKQLVIRSVEKLSAEDKSAVAAALGGPTQPVTDAIWLRVVTGFLVVFVGAFVAMAVYIYFDKKVEMLLTVFTTVAAFLGGLLAPSPVNGSRG